MTSQRDLFPGLERPNGSAKPRNSNHRSAAQHLSSLVSTVTGELQAVATRLSELESRIEQLHSMLSEPQTIKESYTTKEAAQLLGKRPYTVRELCRLQRVNAYKAPFGRGGEKEWRITHEEIERIRNEGLLPIPDRY